MRVVQNAQFLSSIVNEVKSGALAPADFQRPYVWEAGDVEAMFVSILKRWPIGAFVLWEPSVDVDMDRVSRGRLGPDLSNPSPLGMHALILDGQNRLATIAWAMAQHAGGIDQDQDFSDQERRTWLSGRILTADFETVSVRFVPEDESRTPTRMPVGALCDSRSTSVALRTAYDMSDEALQWFGDEVPACIREARVQTTTLQNATTKEAIEAFLHICRVGQPMDPAHLLAALNWSEDETPSFRP